MAYFLVKSSYEHITQRLQNAERGMNKIRKDSRKILKAEANRKYGIPSSLNALAPVKTPEEKKIELEIADRFVTRIGKLEEAQKKLDHRYTYFRQQTKSVWGLFKSYVPFTKENNVRRDLSASIGIFEKHFSKFTNQVQEFSNKGLKAKI